MHHPLTGQTIDFAKTAQSDFRKSLFEALKKKRKVALRLGHLQDRHGWIINRDNTKALLSGKVSASDIDAGGVRYDIGQKGIDIKIGVDITSLALKRQVEKIVLVSGDSDFVPAAKMARREGIDFILDPMWNPINPALHEHIDGLMSQCPKPYHMRSNQPKRSPKDKKTAVDKSATTKAQAKRAIKNPKSPN